MRQYNTRTATRLSFSSKITHPSKPTSKANKDVSCRRRPTQNTCHRPTERPSLNLCGPTVGRGWGGGASRCAVQLRVVSTYLRIYDLFNLLNVGIMLSGEKATSNTKTALPPESLQRSAAATVCVCVCIVCVYVHRGLAPTPTHNMYTHTHARTRTHAHTHVTFAYNNTRIAACLDGFVRSCGGWPKKGWRGWRWASRPGGQVCVGNILMGFHTLKSLTLWYFSILLGRCERVCERASARACANPVLAGWSRRRVSLTLGAITTRH